MLFVLTGSMPQTPKLDCSIASTRYQNIVIGSDLHGGALGYDHAVHITVVRKVSNTARVHLENVLGFGDQAPTVIVAPRRARTAGGLGVKETVVSSVRVLLRLGGHTSSCVVETDPLDGGILRSNVEGLVLGAVRGAEDVADVVGAVDLV